MQLHIQEYLAIPRTSARERGVVIPTGQGVVSLGNIYCQTNSAGNYYFCENFDFEGFCMQRISSGSNRTGRHLSTSMARDIGLGNVLK